MKVKSNVKAGLRITLAAYSNVTVAVESAAVIDINTSDEA
jgi:hypothetical protein